MHLQYTSIVHPIMILSSSLFLLSIIISASFTEVYTFTSIISSSTHRTPSNQIYKNYYDAATTTSSSRTTSAGGVSTAMSPSSTFLLSTLSSETTTNQGQGNGKVKEAIRKMRGVSVSVSVEFHPSKSHNDKDNKLSSMEMEILSQDLRKAKVGALFTSDIDAIQILSKEQQSAQGNFPGPCPIIYNGVGSMMMIQQAIDNGASAIVVSSDDDHKDDDDVIMSYKDVDIIYQIENIHQLQKALDVGYQYAFLIKDSTENGISNDNLTEMLSQIPEESIIIYSLQSMQANSNEITRGKEVVQLSSTGTNKSKIDGLMFENACVGDEEDLKYTNFIVGGVTKKASSTFAMTGLTGSTNGHFGTLSDNVSIEDAKWKRMEVTEVDEEDDNN